MSILTNSALSPRGLVVTILDLSFDNERINMGCTIGLLANTATPLLSVNNA